MGARYYTSLAGRFLSPDVPFMDQNPANPQWGNLYACARNNVSQSAQNPRPPAHGKTSK
jgi:hypothetical protein